MILIAVPQTQSLTEFRTSSVSVFWYKCEAPWNKFVELSLLTAWSKYMSKNCTYYTRTVMHEHKALLFFVSVQRLIW